MHKQATPDHPIHELIANRWSPYAFSGQWGTASTIVH